MVLGSATAIMAMGLARLGTPVAFVGRVGDDVWGRYCLDDMASRGIDLSRVIRGGGLKTGVTVSITHPLDRALVTYLGAISALTGADVPDAAMAGLDHLHASSFFFQEGLRPDFPDLFARARRAGLTTSLDTGFDPSERWDGGLRETLLETDLFFPNEVELAALAGTEDPAEGLRRLENGRTRVVAKLGKSGAMTLEGGQVVQVPAYPVETIDTTGAGDSFNAGFLHRWLQGAPIVECLRLGAACGALSTLGLGGTGAQPTLADAEALQRAHS
jgi:sugar/nucleoside kinase (ribokinase family)